MSIIMLLAPGRIQFSVIFLLPDLKDKIKTNPNLGFLRVCGISILQVHTINSPMSCTHMTARKNTTNSLTSTPHKRMIFSFKILDLLETAYI
jgi:hypothetical protein